MFNPPNKLLSHSLQDALKLIGGRWRGQILGFFCDGPKRFLELKIILSPITARMLIRELRFLNDNLLVVSEKNTASLNSVAYSLSAHGASLKFVIGFYEWSVFHRQMVLKRIAE